MSGSNNKGGDYLDPRDPLNSGDLKSVWVSRRALRFDHRIDTYPHEGGNMDGLFVKKAVVRNEIVFSSRISMVHCVLLMQTILYCLMNRWHFCTYLLSNESLQFSHCNRVSLATDSHCGHNLRGQYDATAPSSDRKHGAKTRSQLKILGVSRTPRGFWPRK